jgi:hypothetical protein
MAIKDNEILRQLVRSAKRVDGAEQFARAISAFAYE